MPETPSGATRLHFIIGDPIAQVKSPDGLTRRMLGHGIDAIVMPAHIVSEQLDTAVRGLKALRNVDGIVVTIPHKFAMLQHCDEISSRAAFLQGVNALRRRDDGVWEGDHFDGPGFLNGIRKAGWQEDGRQALLVGAGGAGSAIALALLEAGVPHLSVHDLDSNRRDRLVSRLLERFPGRASVGSDDPRGSGLVVNATPMGMRPGDPLPVQAERLSLDTFVGDVITAPAVSPLVEAARRIGCPTQVGAGMFDGQADLLIAFLLGGDAEACFVGSARTTA